jgi:hypothetical protein
VKIVCWLAGAFAFAGVVVLIRNHF